MAERRHGAPDPPFISKDECAFAPGMIMLACDLRRSGLLKTGWILTNAPIGPLAPLIAKEADRPEKVTTPWGSRDFNQLLPPARRVRETEFDFSQHNTGHLGLFLICSFGNNRGGGKFDP
jgi:hypothetical protein